MNLIRLLIFVAAALCFAGCETSTSSSKPATMPPSGGGSEIPPTGEAAPATADSSPGTATSAAASDRPLPLKDMATKKGFPLAIKTKWTGLVKSPYAQDKQLVDVSAYASGTLVKCPHTGKIFVVP